MSETAKVFKNRQSPGEWCVGWVDDDGACEATVFSGHNARDRALLFANCQYPSFEVINLPPYP
jgi:hypothetical protein